MITPIATRLTRGQDLKLELQKLVTEHNISAGSVASCVGCVSQQQRIYEHAGGLGLASP